MEQKWASALSDHLPWCSPFVAQTTFDVFFSPIQVKTSLKSFSKGPSFPFAESSVRSFAKMNRELQSSRAANRLYKPASHQCSANYTMIRVFGRATSGPLIRYAWSVRLIQTQKYDLAYISSFASSAFSWIRGVCISCRIILVAPLIGF